MDNRLFALFCDKNNINGETRAAFREYLNKKYHEGTSDRINFAAEWAEFYRESTGKVE